MYKKIFLLFLFILNSYKAMNLEKLSSLDFIFSPIFPCIEFSDIKKSFEDYTLFSSKKHTTLEKMKKFEECFSKIKIEVSKLEEYLFFINESRYNTEEYCFESSKNANENFHLKLIKNKRPEVGLTKEWTKHLFFFYKDKNEDKKKISLVINKSYDVLTFSLLEIEEENLIKKIHKNFFFSTFKSRDIKIIKNKGWINKTCILENTITKEINPYDFDCYDLVDNLNEEQNNSLFCSLSESSLKSFIGQCWARITLFFLEEEKKYFTKRSELTKKIANKTDTRNKKIIFLNKWKSKVNIEKKLQEDKKLQEFQKETKIFQEFQTDIHLLIKNKYHNRYFLDPLNKFYISKIEFTPEIICSFKKRYSIEMFSNFNNILLFPKFKPDYKPNMNSLESIFQKLNNSKL